MLDVMGEITNNEQQGCPQGVKRNIPTSVPTPISLKPSTPFKCYNCNEEGHLASRCEKPRRETRLCNKCGARDHQVRSSPQRKPTRNVADSSTLLVEEEHHFVPPYTLKISCRKLAGNLEAIVDTGSHISFLAEAIVVTSIIEPYYNDRHFKGINSSKLDMLGIVKDNLIGDNFNVNVTLHIVSSYTMSGNLVLGRDFVANKQFTCYFDNQIHIVPIENSIHVGNDLEDICTSPDNTLEIDSTIAPKYCKELETVLNEYYLRPERGNGPTVKFEMNVNLYRNHKPILVLAECHIQKRMK
ncbi:Zinc knuckle [Popillia japonica]|uniref:Zinc knuckle n=1 Tax=Popillia japonica TaxID=7064 RepID=A0AAW1I8W9_POPJA